MQRHAERVITGLIGARGMALMHIAANQGRTDVCIFDTNHPIMQVIG